MRGRVVHVDPWSVADLSQAKPADLILVTDDPSHHLDPAAIERLRKPGAPVVVTAKAHENFSDGTVLANGERGDLRGHTRRGGRGIRHDARAAVASPGRSQRLRRHARRPADLLLGGGGVRAGDPGAGRHQRGVPADEPAARPHAAAAGGGVPQDVPAEGGLPCTTTTTPPRAGSPTRASRVRTTRARLPPRFSRCATRSKASRSSCATATGIRGAEPRPRHPAGRPCPPSPHSLNLISPRTLRRSRSPKMCCWMVWLNRLFTLTVVMMAAALPLDAEAAVHGGVPVGVAVVTPPTARHSRTRRWRRSRTPLRAAASRSSSPRR